MTQDRLFSMLLLCNIHWGWHYKNPCVWCPGTISWVPYRKWGKTICHKSVRETYLRKLKLRINVSCYVYYGCILKSYHDCNRGATFDTLDTQWFWCCWQGPYDMEGDWSNWFLVQHTTRLSSQNLRG